MFRTGLLALDTSLFGGTGLPSGTVIEIHGTQDSGKTALALAFCKQFQDESNDPVGWVCAETNISKRNFDWAGVDSTGVVTVRQTFDMPGLIAIQLLMLEGCKLVVLDSISALIGSTTDIALTKLLSAELYKIKCVAAETNSLVILINQERNIPMGRVTTRTGTCPALNRLTDCQIKLISGQGLYRGGVQEGIRIYFKVIKNGPNFSDWNKVGRFNISYKDGLKNSRIRETEDGGDITQMS